MVQKTEIFYNETKDGKIVALQYGEDGNLYVNDKKIQVVKKISLNALELFLASMTTLAVVASSCVSVLEYLGH